MAFALFGKLTTHPGRRDEFLDLFLPSARRMDKAPGCRMYLVFKDAADPDAVWVSEIWDSEADHKASLQLGWVRAAITQAMPLLTGAFEQHVLEPLGGRTLVKSGQP